MARIRRLVLDVLKPHEPNIVEFAGKLTQLAGIDSVNITIYEVDLEVENAKVTLIGEGIDYLQVKETIRQLGGAVHSLDEVVAGKAIIEAVSTPQD